MKNDLLENKSLEESIKNNIIEHINGVNSIRILRLIKAFTDSLIEHNSNK